MFCIAQCTQFHRYKCLQFLLQLMNFLYQMHLLAFAIPTYIDAAAYLLCHTITYVLQFFEVLPSYISLVPRPHPAFRRLQCGESLGTRLLIHGMEQRCSQVTLPQKIFAFFSLPDRFWGSILGHTIPLNQEHLRPGLHTDMCSTSGIGRYFRLGGGVRRGTGSVVNMLQTWQSDLKPGHSYWERRWEIKTRKKEKTVTQGGTRNRNLANGLPCSNQLSYWVTQQLSG